MNTNTNKIKEIQKILKDFDIERDKLMDLHEYFSILNFLFKEPELLKDNIPALYGMAKIIRDSSKIIENMHNEIDISLKINKLLQD